MKGGKTSLVSALLMVAMVVAQMRGTTAADCNPVELSPCLGAISGSGKPTPACCSKLKQQVPCFCQYFKNPALKPYIGSPNAKKVAAACGVPWPTC